MEERHENGAQAQQDDYYADLVSEMLDRLHWSVIEQYMDDDLREELHFKLAPCTNEVFLLSYVEKHAEKYGTDFVIN